MQYKFPNVYPTITDASGIIVNNMSTSCAYVGLAEYGPVLTPTYVSNLREFSAKFGTLNSKYGYAGYSLAVAAETINDHYFVRVVPTGDPEASDEERKDDAKWGSAVILTEDSTATQPAGKAYYYEQITKAADARDNNQASGLFVDNTDPEHPVLDKNSAMIIATNDPSNRKFYVSITDSTINENRAYPVIAPTVFEEDSGEDPKTTVTVTLEYKDENGNENEILQNMYDDADIVVSKMKLEELNGRFKLDDYAIDEENNIITITYIVNGSFEIPSNVDANARIGLYPEPNKRTFSLTVMEKVGRIMNVLEEFNYCTLYYAKDNFGESTYVEDVVNGSSNYVQVFVNNNFMDADPDAIVIPANVAGIEVEGGQSGSYQGRADVMYKDLIAAWDLFKDRTQVNVTLLMNSGYVTKNNVSYQNKMLEIAEYRRDCFALLDAPLTETEVDDLSDWRKNTLAANTYRGAVSAPWVKSYDSVQGRANFAMCPSAYIAKLMGANNPWIAPAGLNRGVLSAATVSPTGLTKYYNDIEGGNLYTDNQINCIIRNPAAGYVNWGQRTLQQKPSALDRINVARTVIYIETMLRDAAKWHVFNNNTAYERMQITLQFSTFLDTILSSEGIQRYSVICDESNNTPDVIANNQLRIDIYLWPTYCAEFILLSTVVQGADTSVTVTTQG